MRATAPARAVAPARKRRFGLWTAILIVAIVVFLAIAGICIKVLGKKKM